MTDPRDVIPGRPEAAFRATLAEQEAVGAMGQPVRPRAPRSRLAGAALLTLGWAPILAIGHSFGRWAGWW